MRSQEECWKALIEGKQLINTKYETFFKIENGRLKIRDCKQDEWNDSASSLMISDDYEIYTPPKQKKKYVMYRYYYIASNGFFCCADTSESWEEYCFSEDAKLLETEVLKEIEVEE